MDFDVVNLDKYHSKICLSAFPGRTSDNVFCIDSMNQFFDFLDSNRYKALVSLVEEHEFDKYIPLSQFKNSITGRNFGWYFHPLMDMTAPDETFLYNFRETHSLLKKLLSDGHCIALHCKGGLGRSGTIAAMLMCDLGFSAAKSIECVRNSRYGAIETKKQEIFVLSCSD